MYRLATASPGQREHVALQRQPFASAWPRCHIAILHPIHLEGFTTCAKHGPSGHKTPVWAFTALPLPSQVTAHTFPCSGSPLPAPGHVAILHLEGFKTCAKHGPSRHKTRLWAFTALPLPSQVTAHTLPCSGSPLPAPGHVAILHLEGFKTCAKHGPSTQNPSVGLYRFATAFPSHREHVALQRQPFASAWPCHHTPFRGFQNVREARAHHDTKPVCGPLPLCHCLPRSPHTRCPAAAALCQCLAMSP